ncbi:hypothetical protein P7K49_034090 [Saguinus oedipus]|uniref:Basic proline-rich protein-like n=1 Tax=Saguinus oedipus TaxID=9490 RepID=A0ABQ9TTR2_SAGOE|nr:hypothetical protein P7K49_034090 [Saguinus oedipus]
MLLSSHRAAQEDTPLTVRSPLGRGSFTLSPGPPGPRGPSLRPNAPASSAGPEMRVPRQPGAAGKVRAAGPAALGWREGRLHGQPQRTLAARRPPSLRGLPGVGPGASATSRAPATPGSAPFLRLTGADPPLRCRRRRVPAAPPSPGFAPGGPSGLPSARPAPAKPGVLHSGRAKGGSPRPRALRPREERRPARQSRRQPWLRTATPRPRCPPPTAHRPTPPASARLRPPRPLLTCVAPRPPAHRPGPAVYTGSDVSGPAPTPPRADAGRLLIPRLQQTLPSHKLGEGAP